MCAMRWETTHLNIVTSHRFHKPKVEEMRLVHVKE